MKLLHMYIYHGLKKEEKTDEKMKPIVCPRCGIKNDPAAKFCSGCSLGLDEKSVMEYDRQKEGATKIGFDIKQIMDDPEILKQMIDMLSYKLEKTKIEGIKN